VTPSFDTECMGDKSQRTAKYDLSLKANITATQTPPRQVSTNSIGINSGK